MKLPKVIHLITLLEMGGAQGNTLYTVDHLPSTEFDVHLWTGRGGYWDKFVKSDPRLVGRLRFLRTLVRPINPLLDLLAVFELVFALKHARPAVLHTHSSKAGIVGRLAARLAGVPVVVHTYHGFGFNDQQRPWTRFIFVWLERMIARFSSTLIFVSESNRQEAHRRGIGKCAQYQLIRSGVPIKDIQSACLSVDRSLLLASLEIPLEAMVVTTVGPFKPQKNLHDFIRMASEVTKHMPSVYFLMIGDGAQREELSGLASSLGISSHVRMPGWRGDATNLLSVSDLFVLTSLWEGLPRSLVEAFSANIPSVCYETDGVLDLFGPGDPNLIKRKDWSAMAKRVVELLLDPELRNRAAFEGRSKISREFDIDVMVEQQVQLYKRLLAAQK